MNTWRWTIAIALAALACQVCVQHDSPIDRLLPLYAAIVTVAAMKTYPEVMIGVPMLVIAEIALIDFGARFLSFGIIVAAALAIWMWKGRDLAQLAFAAVFLLHAVPSAGLRDLFLALVCCAIVLVLGSTPFGVAIAVITALITPVIPLRTLAIPLLVLGVAIAARAFGMPRFKLVWPSTVMVAFAIVFFAWSGLVARAFPFFLRRTDPEAPRHPVTVALKPRETLTLDVPESARSLIVSGANVAHLRRGAELGRIEPGAIPIRIGDAADWGAFRREQAYGSRNPLPRDFAGRVRGFGYETWIDGAGRIALPPNARTIQVTAAATLPQNAALQVEGFE